MTEGRVTYSLAMSLDGFIVGPDGNFDFTVPDEEVFAFATEEVRQARVHVMGRRLYETMRYWETAVEDPSTPPAEQEFAAVWNPLPKIVFSTTLTEVDDSARLATGDLAEEIGRLRAEPGAGNIAIGGATLAAEAARLDLIDEYLVRVFPVLVGGGIPFFARHERQVDLELVDSRSFQSGVVFLHHRVVRS
jgi:dihydrofolate reductase